MAPYSKRPERVEAIQWIGTNRGAIEATVPPGMLVWSEAGQPGWVNPDGSIAWFPVGYWILYEGALGLMTDAYFTATYEPRA
jgi:hypothetical protein